MRECEFTIIDHLKYKGFEIRKRSKKNFSTGKWKFCYFVFEPDNKTFIDIGLTLKEVKEIINGIIKKKNTKVNFL